jgi:hypothetical protein
MLSHKVVSELSSYDETGAATAYGVVLQQAKAAPSHRTFAVPEGQVFLIDTVVVQADPTPAGIDAGFDASPALTSYGITLNDASGTSQSSIQFLCFRRWQQTFVPENSPNWRNAPPGNAVVWKPKYPIPVPSTWSINCGVGGEWANQVAVYGRMISTDGARTAGYNVNNSSTDADRSYGIITFTPIAGQTTHIPARAGKSIRILDVNVRMQPETGGATNKITLSQTDGRTIFSWTNNNPSDLLDVSFSPDIFLAENVGLRSIGTIAATASVIISYEYVDIGEVPGNHWWGYVEPDLPTPTVTKIGLFSNAPSISTVLTCFYPRRATTKTSSTQGFQHLIKGYTFNIQKDTATAPDQTACCISTGSAGGTLAFGTIGTTQANVQISPTFTSAAHDQCVYGAVDSVVIPCAKDNGAIYVDSLAVGAATGFVSAIGTPTSTIANIDEWSFTIWGSTIPTKFTNPSNRGV